MARTKAARRLTQDHKTTQLAIRADALRDAIICWNALDPTNIDASWGNVEAALLGVIARHRYRSVITAGNYYRLVRYAEGAGGQEPDLTTTLNNAWMVPALVALRVTGPVALKQGLAMRRPLAEAMDIAMVQLLGAVGRIVLEGGRNAFVQHVAADNASR